MREFESFLQFHWLVVFWYLVTKSQYWTKYCRLQIFEQFPFTTSEAEQDNYHQKMNVRIAEWRKTWDLRKFGDFKKITDILGIKGERPAGHLKGKFWQFS